MVVHMLCDVCARNFVLSHLHTYAVQMSRKTFAKLFFDVRFSPNAAMYWL